MSTQIQFDRSSARAASRARLLSARGRSRSKPRWLGLTDSSVSKPSSLTRSITRR